MKRIKMEGGKYVCPKFILCTVLGFTLIIISNKNMDGGADMAKVTDAFRQLSLRICQK